MMKCRLFQACYFHLFVQRGYELAEEIIVAGVSCCEYMRDEVYTAEYESPTATMCAPMAM